MYAQMDITKIKVIVCDLDDTLLRDNKTISKETCEYLIQLQKNGYRLVLATSRYRKEIVDYAAQLQMEHYGGFLVTSNGATVYNLKTGHREAFSALNKEESKMLIRTGLDYGLSVHMRIGDDFYCQTVGLFRFILPVLKVFTKIIKPFASHKLEYLISLLHSIHFVRNLEEMSPDQVHKIVYLTPCGRLNPFMEYIQNTYQQKYHFFVVVNRTAAEICHSNVSKKNAVEWILQELGLTMENIIAFGDNSNDEMLLQSAGISVTMKNGSSRTIAKAKLLSEKTNDEDGVMDCLIKMGFE